MSSSNSSPATSNSSIQTSESFDCELFPNHPDDCVAILWCKYLFSTLSIIGCICILFIIWLFKKYTEFTQRMIVNLSIASLLIAVAYITSELGHMSSPVCTFQGAFLQYNLWTVMLWYMCIVLNLFLNVVWEKTTENLEKLYIGICWGSPFLMAGLPFIEEMYGPAGSWCWMKNDWRWRFGTWYIWSIFSIVLVLIFMIWILCVLRNKPNFQSNVKVLRLYPIVYFLVNVFPVANRIQNAIESFKDHDVYIFPLLLLQTISGPLLGVANAVVFVLDRPTVDAINCQTVKAALIRRFDKKGVIREYPLRDFQISIVQNSFQDSTCITDIQEHPCSHDLSEEEQSTEQTSSIVISDIIHNSKSACLKDSINTAKTY